MPLLFCAPWTNVFRCCGVVRQAVPAGSERMSDSGLSRRPQRLIGAAYVGRMLALRTAAKKGSYRSWLTKSGQGKNPSDIAVPSPRMRRDACLSHTARSSYGAPRCWIFRRPSRKLRRPSGRAERSGQRGTFRAGRDDQPPGCRLSWRRSRGARSHRCPGRR